MCYSYFIPNSIKSLQIFTGVQIVVDVTHRSGRSKMIQLEVGNSVNLGRFITLYCT